MAQVETFKRDNHLRDTLFHPDSFQHQGKANLYLLFAILKYLPTTGIIVDPMAGTGSAMAYTDYAYKVITGELEPHWAKLCQINRQTITLKRLWSSATVALCNQWDAARLPLQDKSVMAVITSPPYWDMLSDWHINSNNLQAEGHPDYGIAYGVSPGNVGNIHIYEDYLRTMFAIYNEYYRVLRPGGIMALILKDRIHKGRRIPICQDTINLACALGFNPIDEIERRVISSLHRNVLHQKHPDIPQIKTESALIFEKTDWLTRPAKTAIIQAPTASAPSRQLFQKAYAFTGHYAHILILDKTGLVGPYWSLDKIHPPNQSDFRDRKNFAFNCAYDLVVNRGFTTGSKIELHCSQAYAKYLAQRLQTLGMEVSNPTQGLNMGQKLKFYTEANNE